MFLINTNTVGQSEDSDSALELAYREMAEDTEAEAEALEWSEALIGDSLFSQLADEALRDLDEGRCTDL